MQFSLPCLPSGACLPQKQWRALPTLISVFCFCVSKTEHSTTKAETGTWTGTGQTFLLPFKPPYIGETFWHGQFLIFGFGWRRSPSIPSPAYHHHLPKTFFPNATACICLEMGGGGRPRLLYEKEKHFECLTRDAAHILTPHVVVSVMCFGISLKTKSRLYSFSLQKLFSLSASGIWHGMAGHCLTPYHTQALSSPAFSWLTLKPSKHSHCTPHLRQ